MPRPNRSLSWLCAAALVLAACRPGDAPKEPTDPNDPGDPQVSREPLPATGGGVAVAVGRRGQSLAKL
jgi:hypothetical protein